MSIKHRSNDNQVPIYSNLMPILSQSSSNPVPIHPNLMPIQYQSGVNQTPIQPNPIPVLYQSDANPMPIQCQFLPIDQCEATRIILSEISPCKEEVSWQQICSLELHLPPVQRLPALILISELGLEIQNTRTKKKKLAPGILTSKLRFRAEVVGGSRKYQDAKFELISWIENQLNIPDPATERVAALDDGSGVAVATSQDSE